MKKFFKKLLLIFLIFSHTINEQILNFAQTKDTLC